MPNDLNMKVSQRISVVLAYGLLAELRRLASGTTGTSLWVPLFLLMLISAFDYWSVQRRFPTVVRLSGGPRRSGNAVAMIGFTFKVWQLLPLALLVGIVAINFRFYAFFMSKGRRLLMFLLLPLHLLYYLYCGLAFASGLVVHLGKAHKERRTEVSECITG